MAAKNVHQRLAEAMHKVSYVQKERRDGMKYTIVSHDRVTALVRPALLDAGIVYYPIRCDNTHNGNRAECSMTVRFANIDAPEDCIDVQSFGYGIDAQDKGPGKAMSYAVKYALLKALGLETGDDPDADDIPHSREDPHVPPPDYTAIRDRLLAAIGNRTTQQQLKALWKEEHDARGALRAGDAAKFAEVEAAFKARAAQVHDDPAMQAAE